MADSTYPTHRPMSSGCLEGSEGMGSVGRVFRKIGIACKEVSRSLRRAITRSRGSSSMKAMPAARRCISMALIGVSMRDVDCSSLFDVSLYSVRDGRSLAHWLDFV